MFWTVVAVVALLVVLLLLWLKQKTVKEETIHTSTTVSMNDLLNFLCCPANLEKYHPYIQKVTDVHETKEFVNFRIEESLGVAGKNVVPMILTTYRDSHVTAVLRLENVSNIAKVILTMSITDKTHDPASTKEAPTSSSSSSSASTSASLSHSANQTTSRIRLLVHVEAPRLLNFFVPGHLVEAWTIALDKTKALLEPC